MANQSVENVKGLLNNKKTRVVMILTFGVVLGTIVYSNMSTSNQQARPKDLAPTITTAEAPKVVPQTGTSTDPNYIDKIKQSNKELANNSEKTGESAVPRLTQSTDREKDPFDLLAKKGNVEKFVDPVVPTATPVSQKQVNQQQQQQQSYQAPVQQPVLQKSQSLQNAEKDMASAMAGLLNSWSPSHQEIEVEYKPKSAGLTGVDRNETAQVVSASLPQTNVATQNNSANKKVAIKAGSVMHAIIITSVNSDEPGPVLAQITTGPYAGGRLIGKFETPKDSDKLVLTFSVLTMQNADKSYQLTAYAIDPETARTGVGSDVDHHYLSRYGMFTAATFLKGYGTALAQQGTTQTATTGPGGTAVTTTFPTLSNRNIAISALGAVGTEVAGSLKDGLKRSPTVTLNSGTEVGVLVMSDTSF